MRQAYINDKLQRYPNTVPLTPGALQVLQQRGSTPTLPSNKWVREFYERHDDEITEKIKEKKDTARVAVLQPDKLAADLEAGGVMLSDPTIGIWKEFSPGV